MSPTFRIMKPINMVARMMVVPEPPKSSWRMCTLVLVYACARVCDSVERCRATYSNFTEYYKALLFNCFQGSGEVVV
jgi:hypothetical protein